MSRKLCGIFPLVGHVWCQQVGTEGGRKLSDNQIYNGHSGSLRNRDCDTWTWGWWAACRTCVTAGPWWPFPRSRWSTCSATPSPRPRSRPCCWRWPPRRHGRSRPRDCWCRPATWGQSAVPSGGFSTSEASNILKMTRNVQSSKYAVVMKSCVWLFEAGRILKLLIIASN